MFGLRGLRDSEHDRPFLLLAAFAVVLLASISATMANTVSEPSLIEGLRRDLGAVRAQLERIHPSPLEAGQQTVAFNADLGDGGSAFRHRSMATILRSANRHLGNLVAGYSKAGNTQAAAIAENAQLALQELVRCVDYLGNAADATSIMWARKRGEAETLLDQLQAAAATLASPTPASQTRASAEPPRPAGPARRCATARTGAVPQESCRRGAGKSARLSPWPKRSRPTTA